MYKHRSSPNFSYFCCRSTAKGVQGALANRVASVLATLVFGALVSTYCAVPILLMSCLLISGGIITYKLPNTANASIEWSALNFSLFSSLINTNLCIYFLLLKLVKWSSLFSHGVSPILGIPKSGNLVLFYGNLLYFS